nr:MAG TPA: hypothetical protein [Caudoviricetes sp.]
MRSIEVFPRNFILKHIPNTPNTHAPVLYFSPGVIFLKTLA